MQQLFSPERLPKKPYCSTDKTATYIRNVDTAMRCAYIQVNTPGLLRWLVFDIDHHDAGIRWEWAMAPAPNFIVINPEKGTGHYYYCLETPVCMTEAGRPKPKGYVRAIHAAIATLVGADPNYVGPLSKNPLHPDHKTLWLHDKQYSLDELAEYLDLDSGGAWVAIAKANNRIANPTGRNLTLFDRLRDWAYAWIDECRTIDAQDAWYEACHSQAEKMNTFIGNAKGDLSSAEVRSVAKSVARWVWKKYCGTKGNNPDFHAIQASRGKRKGFRKRIALLPKARLMREQGASNKAIARELGVTSPTIANWFKRASK